jgi:hypothetical protein
MMLLTANHAPGPRCELHRHARACRGHPRPPGQARPCLRRNYSRFRSYGNVVGWAKPTGPAGACHRAGQRPDPLGRPDDRLRAPTAAEPPVGTAHRSRACPTSALQGCRNRQQPISIERAFAHPASDSRRPESAVAHHDQGSLWSKTGGLPPASIVRRATLVRVHFTSKPSESADRPHQTTPPLRPVAC